MIILDTNVVSEVLRPQPEFRVVGWLDNQTEIHVHLTAISMGELRSGVEIMPDGKRKAELQARMSEFLRTTFGSRILSYDVAAAEAYAILIGELRRKGRAISIPDCQIAAIAKAHGYPVATRDAQPFLDAGVKVINPWTDE